MCGGQGWLIRDLPPTHPQFGEVVPCACMESEIAARRMRRLEAIDGLTPEERTYRFDDGQFRAMPGSATEAAVQACRAALDAGGGIVTLTGPYGVGKTRILISAVNEAKDRNKPAVYTTMRDLLAWLREAFSPTATDSFSQRWDTLREAPVLVIDELDKANTTSWAMEQFSSLVDYRWRHMAGKVTIYALNKPVGVLPGDIADRIMDGRAKVIEFTGGSRRPMLR